MGVTAEDSRRRKLVEIRLEEGYQLMRRRREKRAFSGAIDGFQPGSAGFRHASYDYIGVLSNEVALEGIDASQVERWNPRPLVQVERIVSVKVFLAGKGEEQFLEIFFCV
uniref:Uncharacterized protein n=1 Tax=Salix viminalis TaxID=40686 RepID=A0A6N2M5J4_SALVM